MLTSDWLFRILLLLAAIGIGVMMLFSDQDEKVRKQIEQEKSMKHR